MELTRQQRYDAKRYAENPNYRKEQKAARRLALGDEEWKRRQNNYARKNKTGASREWVDEQRARQRGLCGICKIPMAGAHNALDEECVDHCHDTGRLRGLLCRACNISVGMYERAQRPAGLRITAFDRWLG